jgi:hypothetical protein
MDRQNANRQLCVEWSNMEAATSGDFLDLFQKRDFGHLARLMPDNFLAM